MIFSQDGIHTSRAQVRIGVAVQSRVGGSADSRPVYTGPLTAMVSEGDDIQTLVLKAIVEPSNGGGKMTYKLLDNPMNLFEMDAETGELRTAAIIDRESLDDPSGLLLVKFRATEAGGQAIEQPLTVVVQDKNDETPRFSQVEYFALIHENLPSGTPLSGLNILATDRDSVSLMSKSKN